MVFPKAQLLIILLNRGNNKKRGGRIAASATIPSTSPERPHVKDYTFETRSELVWGGGRETHTPSAKIRGDKFGKQCFQNLYQAFSHLKSGNYSNLRGRQAQNNLL